MKDFIMTEELAFHWCRLNDPTSFYKDWSKDRVRGAMGIIEHFVEKEELRRAWKKYIKFKNKIVS